MVKSDVYKDRTKKRLAWNQLLEIYKEIEVEATELTLKKRITNIRSCFRRELKKIEATQRSGAGIDDEHIPNLWYFQMLYFLHDQESQLRGVSTLDDGDMEEANGVPATPATISKTKKSVGDQKKVWVKEALEQLAKPNETTVKDDASIYGEGWAASYRKLSPLQQIYAKKAIDDILIQGQLHLLTLDTVSIKSSPPLSDVHSSGSSSPSLTLQFQRKSNSQPSLDSSLPSIMHYQNISTSHPSIGSPPLTIQYPQHSSSYRPQSRMNSIPVHSLPHSPPYQTALLIPSQDGYKTIQQLVSDEEFVVQE